MGVSTRKKIKVSNSVLLILPDKSESLFHASSIFPLSHDDNIPASPTTRDNVKNKRRENTRYNTRNPTVITSTVSFDVFFVDLDMGYI